VQSALFDADAERELATAFNALEGRIDERVKAGQYGDALSLIASDLRAPIDRFFTEVFVMVDDPGIRENRLRFLRHIATTLNRIAYFHMLAG
jgi:glycyl-tRNA synthetase beta chain